VKFALVGPAAPYRGGIAHYGAAVDEALTRRGHETRRFNYSRLYPQALFPGRTQYDDRPGGFEGPSERCLDSLAPWTWWASAGRICDWPADAALLHSWHPFFAPALATLAWRLERAGIPALVLCHNVQPHEPTVVDRALLAALYRTARRFVVQASSEATALRKVIRSDAACDVHPHPPYDIFARRFPPPARETARRTLGLADGRRLLLFFGYVRRYKGLDRLLEALPPVRAAGADVELLVAGEFYEPLSSYRERVQALGLSDRVRLLDRYVPNAEVPDYLAAADLVVVPYRSATQSGVAQLAAAYGVPALVTRVGGLADTDDAEGLIRFAADATPAGLARSIAETLAAPPARRAPIGSLSAGWFRLAETLERLATR
jgi:D-inositol-3-phosphate glycosyltransferase